MDDIDKALFLVINANANTAPWLVSLGRHAALSLGYGVAVILVGLLWQGRIDVIVKACVAIAIGLLLNGLVHWICPLPRPFVLGWGRAWIDHAPTASFPSNHVTVVACLTGSLFMARAWGWAVVALMITVVMAWARIFVGVHFPSDTLGSVVCAMVACALMAAVSATFTAPPNLI